MKKEQKSFNELLKAMNGLSEDRQGKLKGGIAVISATSDAFFENSGTCTNTGNCDKEVNSGLCFNNKTECPKSTS
ncbi:hypothetical protein [Pedobacter soli]|uniref:Uncharacterized protein n=1 Tax=Pedobacter soli TaxID=390242 RepID=A0A1G6I5G1_9SPHI|nr:hypothetical protein [Pedobacter soli]SDC01275.1 hypothetical protein SAMN04488024_10123 [Pedobacter soli]